MVPISNRPFSRSLLEYLEDMFAEVLQTVFLCRGQDLKQTWNISTQKLHKHRTSPSLSQSSWQTIQKLFTFHDAQPRLSPVIDSYRVFRGMWQALNTFLNLDYPVSLINSSINKFLHNIDNVSAPDKASDATSNIVVPLPFKDQKSA